MLSRTPAVMVKSNAQGNLPGLRPETVTVRRFEGELSVVGQNLVFHGRDMQSGSYTDETIPLGRILDVFLVSGGRFGNTIVPSNGVGGTAPFGVRFQSADGEQTTYFNTYVGSAARFNPYPGEHSLDGDGRNKKWFQELLWTLVALQGGAFLSAAGGREAVGARS